MTMLAETKRAGALTLADYEARIHLYKEQIGTGYIGIGRTLIEAKEARVVPHGQWETWMTETTGLTARQAQRCMQAAAEIRDGSAMARLEMSKALMLLGSGLDDDAREEIARKAADEGTTVRDLREELRKAKLQIVQETGAAAEIREELKKAQGERDSLAAQMRATMGAYQQKLDEEAGAAYRRGADDAKTEAQADIRKEFQGKIDYINGERQRAEERIRTLQAELEAARKSGSAQWDRGYQAGIDQGAEIRREVNEQRTREIDTLQEALDASEKELEEQRQRAEELKKRQGTILAAAEEAEKRAADAEAELEALREGQDPDRAPAAIVLAKAVNTFFGECELMPWYPDDLRADRGMIISSVEQLEDWCRRMRQAMDAALEGEGAVL